MNKIAKCSVDIAHNLKSQSYLYFSSKKIDCGKVEDQDNNPVTDGFSSAFAALR
jgi:hypothetical protein